MRPILVAGNWKMNGTLAETRTLLEELLQRLDRTQDTGHKTPDTKRPVEIVVCPPFTALSEAAGRLKGKPVALGAQDLHWEAGGAFTGEISAGMLKELGCTHVILGHSERRHLLMEPNGWIRKKLGAALAAGLTGILCVGETLAERENDQTWAVIEKQLSAGLDNLTPTADRLLIAYEPVWAIGTGKTATPEQAQAVHRQIREWLAERFDPKFADRARILYGGSVKADNAETLLNQPDIDGALVGGASLKAKEFAAIIAAAPKQKEGTCCTESS
ncbi:MAG: triose-phosphate isomerase [Candidatus Omnitrophica bacterium CG11_big_fil_rev_8_21_14_0_20_64_10]|nr:MAG: triose-phosphate isomerase [Candidatus Omnitrophica bacterium CG11_big_fil_rev_8_21_14_0_20_64_10]